MTRIVRDDFADGCHGLVYRPKRKEPLTDRQNAAEAGVLHDCRPPGSEVARRPFAEPPGLALDVSVLGDAPLGHRRPRVLAEAVEIGAHLHRIDEPPALSLQVIVGRTLGV